MDPPAKECLSAPNPLTLLKISSLLQITLLPTTFPWKSYPIEIPTYTPRGATGGILVFWDNRVFELVDLEEGEYSISCRFKNCEDGVVWVYTGVYGPVCRREREDFWEELGAIGGLWNNP